MPQIINVNQLSIGDTICINRSIIQNLTEEQIKIIKTQNIEVEFLY